MFRSAPWTLVGLLLLACPACASEITNTWIRGVFTGKSPRPVALAESEAWRQAGALAERAPDSFVLVGSGQSMQPLYAPGAILVLQRFPFELLERGQTVLYRNRANRVVAHVLVARAHDGWRVAGLNNSSHDMEPVSANNLVGVVIAAFQPAAESRVRLAGLSP